jgi:hypothetical protein
MDYREFQETYGNKVNRAITDQKFIDWLITVLQAEGFGDAKTTNLIDGYNTKAVLVAEDATTKTYKVNYFDSRTPLLSYLIDEGLDHEWGKIIAASGLNIDITITRTDYALDAVDFENFSEADKNRTEINTAGVNDDLNVDYPWVFNNVNNTASLNNGDTVIGTVTLDDENGGQLIASITLVRKDRYMWGIMRGAYSVANIVAALEAAIGDVVPADDDADFLELTTGIDSFPDPIDVDTVGLTRTLFIATVDPDLQFTLDNDIPFVMDEANNNIDLNAISGGVANVVRSYRIMTIDLSTNFTLEVL